MRRRKPLSEKEKLFDKSTFEARLREVTHGISNVEISQRTGIPQSSISKWMKRDAEVITPTTENLVKLAKEFDCSIDYLLGLSDYYNNDRELSAKDICGAILEVMKSTRATFEISDDSVYDNNGALIESKMDMVINLKDRDVYVMMAPEDAGDYYRTVKTYPEKNRFALEFFKKYYGLLQVPDIPQDMKNTLISTWLKEVEEREKRRDTFYDWLDEQAAIIAAEKENEG